MASMMRAAENPMAVLVAPAFDDAVGRSPHPGEQVGEELLIPSRLGQPCRHGGTAVPAETTAGELLVNSPGQR
jgi:hypothetical protein